MNRFVKNILLVGMGGAIGFVTGYYYSKRKYEKLADEEVNEVRNLYLRKLKENDDEMDKLREEAAKINNKIEEYSGKKKVAETEEEKKPSKPSQSTNYYKISNGIKEEEKMAEAENPEEDNPDRPYIITYDEFANDKNDYLKLSLSYYMDDDTLIDEDGSLADIEETVSSDIFNQINEIDDADIYVRNDTLETDFEITKIDGRYHDEYGGY